MLNRPRGFLFAAAFAIGLLLSLIRPESSVNPSAMNPDQTRGTRPTVEVHRSAPRESHSRTEWMALCGHLENASAAEFPALYARSRAMGIPLVKRAVLARWLEVDAEGAIAAAEASPNHQDLNRLFEQWIIKDSKGALQAVLGMPAGPKRFQASQGCLAGLARVDGDRFLEFTRKFPENRIPSEIWERAFASLLDKYKTADPDTWLASMDVSRRAGAITGLSTAWAKYDPAAAYDWTTTITDAGLRRAAMKSVLEVWGLADPIAAGPYLRVDGTTIYSGMVEKSALALAQKEPDRVLPWLKEHQFGGFFDRVVGRMETIDDLLNTLASLPHEEFEGFTGEIGYMWPNFNPGHAAAYLLKAPEDLDVDQFVYYVAQRFSQAYKKNDVDLADGLQWAEQLPLRRGREAVSTMLGGSDDHVEAARLIDGMESGELKAFAQASLLPGFMNSDPEAAVVWVLKQSSDALRQRALEQIDRTALVREEREILREALDD